MADKTTTLTTQTGDSIYPNVLDENIPDTIARVSDVNKLKTDVETAYLTKTNAEATYQTKAGRADYVSKTYGDGTYATITQLGGKQDKLTAGAHITIEGTTISATRPENMALYGDLAATDGEFTGGTGSGGGEGGASVQQVNAYGEGGTTTIEKGKISTDLTGVELKVPFVLNIYEDSTLSGTPTRIVMTNKVGENIYLGAFDFLNHYLVNVVKGTNGKYSYSSSIVPNATGNTLFNKPILVPEDLVDPTPILPCTASDNGKVLSVVNGEAQWANAGGGSAKLYAHNIVLLENSISEYLYIKHISSKQLKVTSIADLNALLGPDSYSFECSGEVKINNTWYNAVAIYWGGSYAKSSVLYNVPSEGEKEASLTIYTSVNDVVKPI